MFSKNVNGYTIKVSTRKNKKYDVYKDDKYITSFGALGYEDYTIHKDEERKKRYIQRHKKNENWNDPNTAGFWALNLLWNKPTIKESIKDIENRFNIKVKKI